MTGDDDHSLGERETLGPALTLAETIGGDATSPAGYTTSTLLGKGGMGEVVLAHDARVGRKVALKRMRAAAPSADALARFLREARIQARLEHPAIVPVYDLGRGADGAPYFTMKRLAGTTLHDQLGGGLPRQALLRAFIDVCRAVDFAHTRGVVHRDLKPTNIMLGDFGEVYVLDWGVARVLGTPPPEGEANIAQPGDALGADDIATLDSQTQVGAVLGTPGYMPPEQLAGAEVTPAADVYALGSMLFEILADEPLHPRGPGAMGSTLATPTASPAERAPAADIAPELDAACVAALAAEPTARPTARQLADRVQAYLDGDRDLERRHALAAMELAAAHAAVASGDPTRRADAVAAGGRALALDPTSTAAAELVSSLMLAPPEAMPPELAAELAQLDEGLAVSAAGQAAVAIAAFFLFAPFLLVLRVTSWPMVLGTFALVGVLVLAAAVMAKRRRVQLIPFLVAYHVFLIVLGRVFGVWVMIPGLIALSSTAMVALPQMLERLWLVLVLALFALLTPVALEHLGLLGSTWTVADGTLVTRSGMLELDGRGAIVFLVVAHLGMIVVNAMLAREIARSRRDAHHRAEMQAWHLRKLVPGSTRPRA